MTYFHWLLPTGGDGRRPSGPAHGLDMGRQRAAESGGERTASMPYLTKLARVADTLGYDGVLAPAGAHCEDAWIVTSALITQTRRVKFLVEFRAGFVEPMLAAHMAATFQHISGGRLLVKISAGNDDEQRAYGDPLDQDTRYTRAEEFLEVLQRAWSGVQFDYHGWFYELQRARLRRLPTPLPRVYLGGSSDAALSLAARQADCYLTWGEPPSDLAEKIGRVRELAETEGRNVRFGLRAHVLTRDTAAQAGRDADVLGLPTGTGLVGAGAQTVLVGSHEDVAERIAQYQTVGVDEFVLSGYPNLEEAFAFAEGVRPLLTDSPGPINDSRSMTVQ